MKRILFTAFFYCIYLGSSAQNLQFSLFAGVSNYQGDLQEQIYTTRNDKPAFGAGLLYDITNHLSARLNFTYGTVKASDKNGKNAVRNLSFSSPISDLQLGLEYNLFNLYETKFTPYIFAGISHFNFNPSAIDSLGHKVFLRPLSTEGEGFYPGRKMYSLGQFAIPFGAGLKFAITDNLRLGVEIGMRKTFTDYLDDVSSAYVDESLLFANKGQEAVSLAFRGNELNSSSLYPADGTQRGNSKNKDWYYFTGLTLSFRFNGNGGVIGGKKSKLGCPTSF